MCMRACVRSGNMDKTGRKVEIEEDLYVVESGGEKGGGIIYTAVALMSRVTKERRKKRNPEDAHH